MTDLRERGLGYVDRVSMLAAVWNLQHTLPDGRTEIVDNVEALCRRVLKSCAPNQHPALREVPQLEPTDWDEALAFLLGQVIVVIDRYRPRDHRSILGAWLKQELRWDLLDYWEKRYGPNGEKRVFDARILDSGLDDGDPGVHRPDGVAAEGASDDPGAWTFPRGWLDADGDRGEARPPQRLGVSQGGGAAVGVDRGGVGAGRRDGVGAAITPRGVPAFVDCAGCGWRHYPWAPNGVDRWHFPDLCTGCAAPLAAAA